ncbi:hypothetical protein N5079_33410 [Planotetraspora sp. A-T 1434]|uniref:hypothetical protein n=1 Tax=Planotetraspora sp. A-T 1434 TaxID=2979219 RepID=UPI0021BFA523|nr:hypothetical protein [Planotetraspora sp. A-T 1434]MCT9935111.1 hypothetical protein [Planotetraspora sp. A-T 1434]
MSDISSARAWPFLVARGRYRGYRTLLAPDFLVAERDYGILDDTVVPSTNEDQANVIGVTTRAGRPLTVVHGTHLVTSADIAEPGTEPADHAPRDQHSRPLQLIYGFVCVDGPISEPHDDDLRICRDTALATYRRFLKDEDAFTVEPAGKFLLRSPVIRRASPPPRQPPQLFAAVGHDGPRPVPAGLGRLLLLTAALAIVAILAVVWLLPPKPHTDCPSTAGPASHTLRHQPPGSTAPTTTCRPAQQKKPPSGQPIPLNRNG